MAAGLGRETAHALLEHSRQALSREALLPSSLWIAGKSFKIGTECMNVIAGDIQLGLRSIDREADALELELIVLSYLTDAVVFTWVFFWGATRAAEFAGSALRSGYHALKGHWWAAAYATFPLSLLPVLAALQAGRDAHSTFKVAGLWALRVRASARTVAAAGARARGFAALLVPVAGFSGGLVGRNLAPRAQGRIR